MTNVDIEMLINSVGKWRIEPSNIIDMPTMGIRTSPYDRWLAMYNSMYKTEHYLNCLRDFPSEFKFSLDDVIINEDVMSRIAPPEDQVSLLDLLKSDSGNN